MVFELFFLLSLYTNLSRFGRKHCGKQLQPGLYFVLSIVKMCVFVFHVNKMSIKIHENQCYLFTCSLYKSEKFINIPGCCCLILMLHSMQVFIWDDYSLLPTFVSCIIPIRV